MDGCFPSYWMCEWRHGCLIRTALDILLCSAAWLHGNCTLYHHYEFPVGCSFPNFYLYTSCWPWCVLWESIIQEVLHVISLVSPLLWVSQNMERCPVQSGCCSFCSCQKELVKNPDQVVFIKLQIAFNLQAREGWVYSTADITTCAVINSSWIQQTMVCRIFDFPKQCEEQ